MRLIKEPYTSFEAVNDSLGLAIKEYFGSNPRVQAVGISRHGEGFGLSVVLKPIVEGEVESLAAESKMKLASEFRGVPVTYQYIPDLIRSLDMKSSGSNNPEHDRHRGLVCGLEIQNYDYDIRAQKIINGYPRTGTLGCFVRISSGEIGLLSNNHVLANKNRGKKGQDRITQPGVLTLVPGDVVATLHDFVDISLVHEKSKRPRDTSKFNEVDAAIALIGEGIEYSQQFLSIRNCPCPVSTAPAVLGDTVFKVGSKTGLTYGQISMISTTVAAQYHPKSAWFKNVIVIESVNDSPFAENGDSGSIVMKETGEIVGLVFAGTTNQTYACLIDLVFQKLQCQLA